VARLVSRRREALGRRRSAYDEWQVAADGMAATMAMARAQASSRNRNRSRDNGIEL
jgi:hypothetical protein